MVVAGVASDILCGMGKARRDPLPRYVDADRRYARADVIAASGIFAGGMLIALAAVGKVLWHANGFNILANPLLLVGLIVIVLIASVPLGVLCAWLVKPFEKRTSHRFEPWRCRRCGYDRRGLADEESACPECGLGSRNGIDAGVAQRS